MTACLPCVSNQDPAALLCLEDWCTACMPQCKTFMATCDAGNVEVPKTGCAELTVASDGNYKQVSDGLMLEGTNPSVSQT